MKSLLKFNLHYLQNKISVRSINFNANYKLDTFVQNKFVFNGLKKSLDICSKLSYTVQINEGTISNNKIYIKKN